MCEVLIKQDETFVTNPRTSEVPSAVNSRAEALRIVNALTFKVITVAALASTTLPVEFTMYCRYVPTLQRQELILGL